MSAQATQIGRPASCLCGSCEKCERREKARLRYQEMSSEERRLVVLARDVEKVRAADRARYYRNREKRLAAMKEWALAHMDRMVELNRAWRSRNRIAQRAHSTVYRAKKEGILVPRSCEKCGAGYDRVHAHHDDYSKPLEVRWLCPSCHGRLNRRYEDAA